MNKLYRVEALNSFLVVEGAAMYNMSAGYKHFTDIDSLYQWVWISIVNAQNFFGGNKIEIAEILAVCEYRIHTYEANDMSCMEEIVSKTWNNNTKKEFRVPYHMANEVVRLVDVQPLTTNMLPSFDEAFPSDWNNR